MHWMVFNTGSSIGKNYIINNLTLIENDSVVKSHCHISFGSKVNGVTLIVMESFIGTGSVTHESDQVVEISIISSGNTVRKNLPAGTSIFSNK